MPPTRSLYDVEVAVFAVVRYDQGLQVRLTPPPVIGQPTPQMQFYQGRDPLPSQISFTVAAMSYIGGSVVSGAGPTGSEEVTLTFKLASLSHDLNAQVQQDMDRLFHTRTRGKATVLLIPGGTGTARIWRESAEQEYDPDSENKTLLLRYRVLYVPVLG